jgi:hypothetical protein
MAARITEAGFQLAVGQAPVNIVGAGTMIHVLGTIHHGGGIFLDAVEKGGGFGQIGLIQSA